MTAPTPEQWWAGLRDDERLAYIAAVDDDLEPGQVQQLRQVGIPVEEHVTASGWPTLFPPEYREHAAEQGVLYDSE